MRAVIFDMDGVIIDSHSVAARLLCESANSYGCNLTIEEIKRWGSLSSRQFWQKVKDQYKLTQNTEELILTYDVDREINLYKEIGLISGVRRLLDTLKENDIRTALATSASRKRMNAVLDNFHLGKLFDKCLCDEDVARSKPHPEIFLKAGIALSVRPEECIVIEDSENGKQAALCAGMKCVGYKGLKHVDEDMSGCHLLVDNFNELDIPILRGL
jgi:beta-phosphoglucomutase